MQEGFRLFPEQASTFAVRVDQLYWFLIAVTVFFGGLIAILVVTFAIRYRRRPGRDAVQPSHGVSSILLELFWTAVPLVLVIVMFVWASKLFIDQSIPPIGAEEVFAVGKQWMWKIQHPNGRREINELHIPVGRPVKITLSSQDVIHSFFIPAFRIKQDAVPGRYTTMWFEATKPGSYHLFCAEYCGTDHSQMIGRVVVMEDMDYQTWLGGYTSEMPVQAGEKLFQEYDCANCHESGRRQRCPTLGGLYGTQVALADGGNVLFDESYIRESILDPRAKVAAGFPSVMPTFRGQLTEEQILALIAYIKSLSPNQKMPAGIPGPNPGPAGRNQ
jgi:cytochrome c oxidase subunit 2